MRIASSRLVPGICLIISLVSVLGLISSLIAACSPSLPPTQAPAQPDPTFEPFRQTLQKYIDETQPYRKEAALAQESSSGKGKPTGEAAAGLRERQRVLAEALRTRLRPNARQSDLFSQPIAEAIRHQIAAVFATQRRALLLDELAEQNAGQPAPKVAVVNHQVKAPRVPPRLIEILPPLPKQLEYDFAGRTLILRDVDADVVVDYLPDALPIQPPAGVPTVESARSRQGAGAPLPMPSLRGGTVFALMGDSGSGDLPQRQVAEAMLSYFDTVHRFPFVLMLGDNLYNDDYEHEFLQPYKPLLDRGVKFYATLGNHDRDLEQHFKPFNMRDTDHYSFDEGNVRFVALNTNHPNDQTQKKWLDGVFADAGDKWRICFFHHPLYSSGQHTAESRDVIRPAFEEALVRNQVNVAFSGHDHLYERVKPQRGVYYFVSGGGGRDLYRKNPSDFDVVGVSEHHFMVAEVAGDRLFFEAVTHAPRVLDCGVIYRTQTAANQADADTKRWLAACDAARPRSVSTAE